MTPDGRITSEFDDVTPHPRSIGLEDVGLEDWDEFEDGLDDAAETDDSDAGADRDDDLADLELVVLDLAGTTVIDDGLIERAFARAAAAAGIGATPEERAAAFAFAREAVGLPTVGVFQTLTSDDDQAQHANAVFESTYADLVDAQGLRAVPGAEELIRRLRSTGVKVALTSSLSPRSRDVVLDALGWTDLADVTLTPGDAGRDRPFPDLPLTALLRTGASSVEGMVLVADTASGIASGIAAGAGLVVGVLTGAHDEQTLLDAGADAVLPSVADLPELLGYEHVR
ncbi:HAD family hydrolase [Leifsonia sp. 2MCAF36]|uniref:HAD family hydrolase n=1 Tax=Leifsonia sp. 2MCAF36 TaxID=3232988 RepID=UPI003F9D872F